MGTITDRVTEKSSKHPLPTNKASHKHDVEPRVSIQQDAGGKTSDGDKKLVGRDDLPASTSEPSYPSGLKFIMIIATLGLVLVLGSLDANIVATAVPTITNDFHTSADVGWYSSAFRLCACASQLLYGKAYKLFVAKHVFMIANVISSLGSLLCAVAVNSKMLVVGRAITGLGFAGLLSGCFIILVQVLPLHKRPLYLGVIGGIESLAIIAAPLLGGVLTQYLNWRWCFWINLPVGVLTLLLTIFYLPKETKDGEVLSLSFKEKILQLDTLSTLLLLLPALTSLFLAFSWVEVRYSWGDGTTIGLLVTSLVLFGCFVANQLRLGDAATLPPRLLRYRSVVAGFIFVFCTNGTLSVVEYYLPTYYQIVTGYSPAKSGYMIIAIIIGGAIGFFIHGAGTTKFGYYAPFMLFGSVVMPIGSGLISSFDAHTTIAKQIIFTAIFGFGVGIGFPGPNTAVQKVLPAQDIPQGLSFMLFGQSVGPAVAVMLGQVLFTNKFSKQIQTILPGENASLLDSAGLSGIVNHASPQVASEIVGAVSQSLKWIWYLPIAMTCTTVIGSVWIKWKSIKPKDAAAERRAEEEV